MSAMRQAISEEMLLKIRERMAAVRAQYTPSYFRTELPELIEMGATDGMIQQAGTDLLEKIYQNRECAGCDGFATCRREVGKEGWVIRLEVHNERICSLHTMCDPLRTFQQEQRWQQLLTFSGKSTSDKNYTFDNFPFVQKDNHKALCSYVFKFAQNYVAGGSDKGVYIHGMPGTAKTHLVLAMVNRLEARRVPVLFIRTDAIFRNMRGMISRKESLDALMETYCTTPVLVIDEFGQESGTEFTVDVMFEILNARFTGSLATFCTSNYPPDLVYQRAAHKHGLDEKVSAIRSRLNQMMKHANMTGEDGRKKDRETF